MNMPQAVIPPVNIRRLREILNAYPPKRSVAVTNKSRNAASHRSGEFNRFDLTNITTTTIKSGTNDAIPSAMPMKRPLDARSAIIIETSRKVT